MARRKIVFVLVEGESDRIALASLINKRFKSSVVHVEVAWCDIFTENKTEITTIQKNITNFVKNYCQINKFKKEDILQVIQITDTDGVYINEEFVVRNENAKDPIYCDNCIETCNVEQIRSRNKKKSLLLNKMSTCDYVYKDIPYKIYYMSCNLDHVLYGERNLNSKDKKLRAKKFSIEYENKYDEFIKLLVECFGGKDFDYKSSWEFIKKDFNSLNRYTNLNDMFGNFDLNYFVEKVNKENIVNDE